MKPTTQSSIEPPRTAGNGSAEAVRSVVADWFAPSPGGRASRLSVANRLLLFLVLVVLAFALSGWV